jgi:transposase
LGIEVRLISHQYVTALVKTNKNDRNDAQAIVEAACRPASPFVLVKTIASDALMGEVHQGELRRAKSSRWGRLKSICIFVRRWCAGSHGGADTV